MRKLAIVGTHPKTRADAPYDDHEWDIWAFNESASQMEREKQEQWLPRVDAIFQMHDRAIYSSLHNRADKYHWNWLQREHDDLRIIMRDYDMDVPNSWAFPLEDMEAPMPALQRCPVGRREQAGHTASRARSVRTIPVQAFLKRLLSPAFILWLLVWAGVNTGPWRLFSASGLMDYVHGTRAFLPFAAAFVSLLVIRSRPGYRNAALSVGIGLLLLYGVIARRTA